MFIVIARGKNPWFNRGDPHAVNRTYGLVFTKRSVPEPLIDKSPRGVHSRSVRREGGRNSATQGHHQIQAFSTNC